MSGYYSSYSSGSNYSSGYNLGLPQQKKGKVRFVVKRIPIVAKPVRFNGEDTFICEGNKRINGTNCTIKVFVKRCKNEDLHVDRDPNKPRIPYYATIVCFEK